MHPALQGFAPQPLWQHFSELSAIPRPPGHEQRAIEYVKGVADSAGAPWREDEKGNVVVYLDGDGGPVVAVQAHLDMVCEKDPGVKHDFYRDPIPVGRDGDRVFARGTTLGADNGIGAAAALALLTERPAGLGPLELVFTVEEETGLHGAVAFDVGLMTASMLINLDSEDPNTLTVGCAGGSSVEIRLPGGATEEAPSGFQARRIAVSGAQGGHSGVNIADRRASAIKVLVRVLNGLAGKLDVRIVSLDGGSAHNVIPRDAEAVILVSPEALGSLEATVAATTKTILQEWSRDEPDLKVSVERATPAEKVLSSRDAESVLRLLTDLPHGVLAMSEHFEGKVETSANLARVESGPGGVRILSSVRSFSSDKEAEARQRIERLGREAGGEVVVEMGYPGWEPKPDSKLTEVAREQFELVNGRPPIVEVLHAGLECGVLVAKKPGMEAISFGPLITGAHSPSEQTTVSTVEAMWRLLTGLIGALSKL